MFSSRSVLKKLAITGAISVGALGLAGCSTAGSEAGADVEDITEDDTVDAPAEESNPDVGPYDDVYNADFYDAYDNYIGDVVTLTAKVNTIVSPESFTIAGTDDTTVEELLVVHDGSMTEIEPGLAVRVTGFVHETFDLPTVEEDMDLDLDNDIFTEWDGVRYIEATSVDTAVQADE